MNFIKNRQPRRELYINFFEIYQDFFLNKLFTLVKGEKERVLFFLQFVLRSMIGKRQGVADRKVVPPAAPVYAR